MREFVAIGPYCWSKAPTKFGALRTLTTVGSWKELRQYGYVIFDAPTGCEIDQVNGALMVPKGESANTLIDRRKNWS